MQLKRKKESPFLLKPKSIENTKYDPIEKIREKMQEREPEQVREKAQETKPEQVREKVQDEEQTLEMSRQGLKDLDSFNLEAGEAALTDNNAIFRRLDGRLKREVPCAYVKR